MQIDDASATQRTVNVLGHEITALVGNQDGDGVPIVFLHGILGSFDFWLSVLPAELLANRRWVSLSLPGHYPGRLAPGYQSQQFTANDFVRVLAQAIRQLVGSDRVALVGWSTGGFAALGIAAHSPELTDSVLSVSGCATGRWHGMLGRLQEIARRQKVGRPLFKAVIKQLSNHRMLFDTALRYQTGNRQSIRTGPGVIETINRLYDALSRHDVDMLAHVFRCIRAFDISDELARIKAPTLVVGGERDPVIPLSHTRFLAERIPTAELRVLRGAGHLFFAEKRDEFHYLLKRWLKREAGSPADLAHCAV